jgi:hypothetical protein
MQPLLCAVADPIHCSEPHTPRAKNVTDRTLPKFGVRMRGGFSGACSNGIQHTYMSTCSWSGPSKYPLPSSNSSSAPQDCSRSCEKRVRDRWNTQLQGNRTLTQLGHPEAAVRIQFCLRRSTHRCILPARHDLLEHAVAGEMSRQSANVAFHFRVIGNCIETE